MSLLLMWVFSSAAAVVLALQGRLPRAIPSLNLQHKPVVCLLSTHSDTHTGMLTHIDLLFFFLGYFIFCVPGVLPRMDFCLGICGYSCFNGSVVFPLNHYLPSKFPLNGIN